MILWQTTQSVNQLLVKKNINTRVGKLLEPINPETALDYLKNAMVLVNDEDIYAQIDLLGYIASCAMKMGNYWGVIECTDSVLNKIPQEMSFERALVKSKQIRPLVKLGNYGQVVNLIDTEIISQNPYDTFCIGVVISGLSSPIQLSSLIEKSDNFLAPCGHFQCSMFPSIEPEILNSFLNKNSQNFKELSQLISNMCFPLGIKPCFGCKFTRNGIENSPDPQKTQQTFYNVIQKENGQC